MILKKVISDKRYRKAFISGFDYGVKYFNTIEDKHFFIYSDHDKDHTVASNQHDLYRHGLRIARKYMQYRYEILTLTVLVFTALLFMFTW